MRRRVALAAAAATLAAAAAALADCSLITSYQGFGGVACLGKIPPKPSGPAGGNEGTAYVGALSHIDFLGSDAGPPLGYDIDDLCTCPDKASCTNPRGPGQP